MTPGTLYIVATPIGNLEDISKRALRILGEVDIIFAEDTREIAKILKGNNIDKTLIPYTDQKHEKMVNEIVQLMESGKSAALVSDSGTPLISDPGFKLVREFKLKNLNVVPIPGPSAIITALSVSGLPTDKFTFLGFAPKKPTARKQMLQTFGALDTTLIFYESPYRIKSFLQEIYETLGDRQVCLAKDLTKVFESVNTDRLSTLLENIENIKEKGEYVVLIAKEN